MNRSKSKRAGGSVSIEVVITALLVAVFAVLAFDLVIVLWGYSLIDQVARNAARAAANTSSRNDALRAARQVAASYTTDGHYVSQPQIPDNQFLFVTNPNNTTPPSGSPFVTVTARANVRLPVPISFSAHN